MPLIELHDAIIERVTLTGSSCEIALLNVLRHSGVDDGDRVFVHHALLTIDEPREILITGRLDGESISDDIVQLDEQTVSDYAALQERKRATLIELSAGSFRLRVGNAYVTLRLLDAGMFLEQI